MASPPASAGIYAHNEVGGAKDPTFCIGYTAQVAGIKGGTPGTLGRYVQKSEALHGADSTPRSGGGCRCDAAPLVGNGLGAERDSLPRSGGGCGARRSAPQNKLS